MVKKGGNAKQVAVLQDFGQSIAFVTEFWNQPRLDCYVRVHNNNSVTGLQTATSLRCCLIAAAAAAKLSCACTQQLRLHDLEP
jgi:hypothetical protein